jgi:hypothetical protein
MAKFLILALPGPNIQICIYTEPCLPGSTLPTLKMVQVLIVNPIGTDFVVLIIVGGYLTIIILMIFKFQD